MGRYRPTNREYIVVLSDGQSLKIVAKDYRKAYLRADAWAKKQEGIVTVARINEMENI